MARHRTHLFRGRQAIRPTRNVEWNQVRRGNAWVTDGAEGFWAQFPAGTSAQEVLDEYLATADYSGATSTFTVRAEIAGNVASVRVGPGGEVLREARRGAARRTAPLRRFAPPRAEAPRKPPWHGPVKDTLNVDEIAKLFDLDEYNDLHERNTDYFWETGDYAYKQAIDDGASEEEAEKAREDAEHEADTEMFHQWHSGVMAAAEHLFGEHRLTLVPANKKPDRYPYEYRVIPQKSWEDAAAAIVETINGVGMFEFNGVKDFLASGPYTPRNGVLTHLHWIKRHPEVYGDRSAQDIYRRSFR